MSNFQLFNDVDLYAHSTRTQYKAERFPDMQNCLQELNQAIPRLVYVDCLEKPQLMIGQEGLHVNSHAHAFLL